MFTRGICRQSLFQEIRLVTRCATPVDMIAFDEWKRHQRCVELVLPIKWSGDPTASQKDIIDNVLSSGGHISKPDNSHPIHSDWFHMIHSADIRIIVEIGKAHPLFEIDHAILNRYNTAVFQWAISLPNNEGCRILCTNGRGTPLYPGFWRMQLEAFIEGKPMDIENTLQPELGF